MWWRYVFVSQESTQCVAINILCLLSVRLSNRSTRKRCGSKSVGNKLWGDGRRRSGRRRREEWIVECVGEKVRSIRYYNRGACTYMLSILFHWTATIYSYDSQCDMLTSTSLHLTSPHPNPHHTLEAALGHGWTIDHTAPTVSTSSHPQDWMEVTKQLWYRIDYWHTHTNVG